MAILCVAREMVSEMLPTVCFYMIMTFILLWRICIFMVSAALIFLSSSAQTQILVPLMEKQNGGCTGSLKVCSKTNLDILLMYWKTLYVYFPKINLFASTKYCNTQIFLCTILVAAVFDFTNVMQVDAKLWGFTVHYLNTKASCYMRGNHMIIESSNF